MPEPPAQTSKLVANGIKCSLQFSAGPKRRHSQADGGVRGRRPHSRLPQSGRASSGVDEVVCADSLAGVRGGPENADAAVGLARGLREKLSNAWGGLQFQPPQEQQCVFPRRSAHLERRLQPRAHSRALSQPEKQAAKIGVQMRAGHPSRFAIRQARHRAADGGFDAAGGTTGAAAQRFNTWVEGGGGHGRDCHAKRGHQVKSRVYLRLLPRSPLPCCTPRNLM